MKDITPPNQDERPYPEPRVDLINTAHQKVSEALKDLPLNPEELVLLNLNMLKIIVDYCQEHKLPFPGKMSMEAQSGDEVHYFTLDSKVKQRINKQNAAKHPLVIPPAGSANLFT